MGYFAHLYVIDCSADQDGVTLVTNIFGSELAPTTYFSWGVGQRPPGMYEYADGTVVSETQLRLLPGYPLVERCGIAALGDSDHCLIEASFEPRSSSDPVLYHLLLPSRFVPSRARQPFVQPVAPSVSRLRERLIATYPVVGSADIRFWISRLPADESLENYAITQLFHPEAKQGLRAEFEFNLGFCKIKLS